MNRLYQQLIQNRAGTPQAGSPQTNIKSFQPQNNLIKSIFNSSNPQEAVQQMINANPQMRNIVQNFQNSGLTPKQFFYQYAQQKGIDPDQFLNSLKQ